MLIDSFNVHPLHAQLTLCTDATGKAGVTTLSSTKKVDISSFILQQLGLFIHHGLHLINEVIIFELVILAHKI